MMLCDNFLEDTEIILRDDLDCTDLIHLQPTQRVGLSQATQPSTVDVDHLATTLTVANQISQATQPSTVDVDHLATTLPIDLTSTLNLGIEEEDENDEFSEPFTQEDLDKIDLVLDENANSKSSETVHREIKYPGCTVYFPYEAYHSQRQMMEKLIQGAQLSQNCLLESPTGTGKTAALVCALRAWQLQFELCEEEKFCKWQEEQWEVSQSQAQTVVEEKKCVDDEEDKDNTIPSPSKKSKVDEEVSPGYSSMNGHEHSFEAQSVPIIYYATRTHSQIKQVVKQLSQTKYKDTPMTILASRKQTCINPEALSSTSVENTCKQFRIAYEKNNSMNPPEEPLPTCPYYRGPLSESNFHQGYNATWDIEDIKAFGEQCGSCPYQEMRPFQKQARIVFCTYNHLLQQYIRKALQIELEGNIVVFDEAHNIEDNCRSIASLTGDEALSSRKVSDVIFKLEESMRQTQSQSSSHNQNASAEAAISSLTMAFTRLFNWLDSQLKNVNPGFVYLPDDSNNSVKKYKRHVSEILIKEMSDIQFGPDQMAKMWRDYFVLEELERSPPGEGLTLKIDHDAMRAVKNILYIFQMLYKKDPFKKELLHFKDFHAYLIKTLRTGHRNHSQSVYTSVSSSQQTQRIEKDEIELNLLCLNPAIVFKNMKLARTVIVTSGTLSPTNSFSTELNTHFQLQLSANHVMGPDRIFSCIINSNTRKDKRLKFNAQNLGDPSMYKDHQDQLLQIILRISTQVPYGILVFVPSSTFISRLKREWEQNGNLQQLGKQKDLFFEHENRSPFDFNRMMGRYREKVERPKGAILFAVLRGKISEGVDFKDNQARAVITIGIPFAPCRSDDVVAKQVYNNWKKSTNRDYLSGKDWYNACAFRALNQAFGRCVRHVQDWGAIFIVESRFSDYMSYRSYLSKWVVDSLRVPGRITTGSLDDVMPHLERFVESLYENSDRCSPDMSF